MGLAILGVLVLVFIALAVLSAKTWQIWHVLIVGALFIATFIFCAFAAATLSVHEEWRSKYEQAKRDLETEQRTNEQLTRPSPNSEELTVGEVSNEVRRTLADRGRVWRNLILADIGDGTVTLDASSWGDEACQKVGVGSDGFDDFEDEEPPEPIPADGEAAAAGPGKPLGLLSNAIVFAFQETPIASLPEPIQQVLFGENTLPQQDRKGLCRIPTYYLGEFKITNDPQAEPTTITLTPTLPLTELQIEQLENPDVTWVLYEMLPVDSHEVFDGITKEQMEAILPPWSEDGQPDEVYNALIDAFVRHNLRASDMDPPERKWMQVRFTQAANPLDVDVQEPTSLPDTPFDPLGRSISDNLRQNEQTKFQPNDVVLLDFATAQEYINQGIAEAIEPKYQRPLRDFERFFRNSAGEIESINRQIAVAQEDLTKLDDSVAKLQQQIAFFTDQEQRLSVDRDGFNMERTVITEYRTALEARWKEVLSELSRLYRANKQLVSRMSSRDDDSAARPDGRSLSSRGDRRR